MHRLINPFSHSGHCIGLATIQNFNFSLRRDCKKKNSYERRAYESVDDKSLS